MDADDDELVQIYEVGRIDAEVVRSLLEGNGIPCVVASEGAGGMYPVNVGFGAGRVLTRRRDAARAKELIYEAERGDFALTEDELPDG
ncbi:MAG: putative signal transducing protein [Actinomycetota bacterium]